MADIKTHLNNIKGALYGKDVRGSIHDGMDAINKEVENTTGRQVDLENTFDQLVINAGNSNAEIVDARVKNDGTSYSKLGDRLDAVDSQLAHIENNMDITPDLFEGSDLEKMQRAFDYACQNRCNITFNRNYDITGGSLFVNKPTNSQRLYVNGNGYSIIKNDTGFIIDNIEGNSYTDNIYFLNIEFINNNYTNSNVSCINFNGVEIDGKLIPKFARINFENCYFKYMYKVVESDTIIQSLTLDNCFVYGGTSNTDFAIQGNAFFDVVLSNTKFERRFGGIYQVGKPDAKYLYNYSTGLRITSCLFEKIEKPIVLSISAEGNLIQGCFFEQVTSYPIEILKNSSSLKLIANCLNGNKRDGSIDNQCFIKWRGNAINTISMGNTSYNFPVHDASEITNDKILSIREESLLSLKNIGDLNIKYDFEKEIIDTFTRGEMTSANNSFTNVTFSNRSSSSNKLTLSKLDENGNIVLLREGIYQVSVTFVYYENPNGARSLKVLNKQLINMPSTTGMFTATATTYINAETDEFILPISVKQTSGNDGLSLHSCTCVINKL